MNDDARKDHRQLSAPEEREARVQLLMSNSSGKVTRHEAELIVRVIAGGAGGGMAGDELFRSVHSSLRKYLLRVLRDDHDARECIQETQLRIFQKLTTFRGKGNKNKNGEGLPCQFSTWCLGIAKYVAMEFRKKRKRVEDNEVTESDWNSADSDDADVLFANHADGNGAVDPEASAICNQYIKMLNDCQEQICHNDLERCLTNGWLEAWSTGMWAPAQDIADACEGKLSQAYAARNKLWACFKAKIAEE